MFVSYHLDHLELRKMISLLRIISLFQVLTFVATNNKPKDTYVGVEGSTLNIYCDYPDGYQDYIKYFCRDPCTYDDYLIQSEGSGTNISKERYTGLDSVSKLVFIVIIKNIAMEDAGVYYCGVEKSGHDILNKVKVFVSGDLTYVAVNERSRDTYVGTKGSTLNIYCDYPDGYQDYIKYFCRDPCTYDDFLIQSDTSGTNISKERYTGLDSVSKLVFIVTIKTLIVEDFGVYYCGVEKSGHDILNKVKVFISGVTMNNKLEDSYLGMEGASVDICCHYPDGYQDYIKYFCRNPCKDDDDILIKSESSNSTIRYTGLDNVTEQNFIVTIRNLVKEDSGVYYCGVEMSGHDILDKVNVFVSREPFHFTSTHAPASTKQSSRKHTSSTSEPLTTETPSVFCIQT